MVHRDGLGRTEGREWPGYDTRKLGGQKLRKVGFNRRGKRRRLNHAF